jgi:hypothetical protein
MILGHRTDRQHEKKLPSLSQQPVQRFGNCGFSERAFRDLKQAFPAQRVKDVISNFAACQCNRKNQNVGFSISVMRTIGKNFS